MAIYQIRLKGKEGMHSYDTFLAQNVEDTIKQATEKGKPAVEEIEGVNLLLCENDIDRVVLELKIKLDGAFTDLGMLVEAGKNYDPEDINFADLDLTMELIRGKTDQIYSTMSALHAITQDMPSRFGYKERGESES